MRVRSNGICLQSTRFYYLQTMSAVFSFDFWMFLIGSGAYWNWRRRATSRWQYDYQFVNKWPLVGFFRRSYTYGNWIERRYMIDTWHNLFDSIFENLCYSNIFSCSHSIVQTMLDPKQLLRTRKIISVRLRIQFYRPPVWYVIYHGR